jgi:hypothetical protein
MFVGLFFRPANTATTIKIGDVVAVFAGGVKLPYNEYVEDSSANKIVGGYAITMNREFVMDFSTNLKNCLASMANSNRCCGSHYPNTEMCTEFIAGAWIAWLEAITVIDDGDEITHDYGDPLSIRANGIITTAAYLRHVNSDEELELNRPRNTQQQAPVNDEAHVPRLLNGHAQVAQLPQSNDATGQEYELSTVTKGEVNFNRPRNNTNNGGRVGALSNGERQLLASQKN